MGMTKFKIKLASSLHASSLLPLSAASPFMQKLSQMITMMRILIKMIIKMMGMTKFRRQLSPPIVWEPFHAKIISNDHAAPVALTNIYC